MTQHEKPETSTEPAAALPPNTGTNADANAEPAGRQGREDAARTAFGILVAEIAAVAGSSSLDEIWHRVVLVAILSVLGGVLFYNTGRMIDLSLWLADRARRLGGILGTLLGVIAGGLRRFFSGVSKLSGRSLAAALSAIVVTALLPFAVYGIAHPPWAPCPVPHEVRLAASSETASAVEEVAGAFMRDTADWRGCRTAHITVTAPESASELRRRLASGWAASPSEAPGPRPNLWIADSRAEVEEIRSATPAQLGEARTVATSPLVIAMPEDTADLIAGDLSEPGALTWDKLVHGVREPRPILRPYPRTSNVGLLASVGLDQQIIDPVERQTVEARVSSDVGWAEDVHDLMCRFLDADEAAGDRVPAIMMTEQQLYEFNKARSASRDGSWTREDCPDSASRPGPVPPLLPLYPAGTQVKDEPNGPDGQALTYQCVPVNWAEQPAPPDLPPLLDAFCDRLATDLTHFGFRDAAGALPPLDAADELVRNAAVAVSWPEDIGDTLARAATPVLGDHVLLAMDVSGSMSNALNTEGSRLQAATDAAKVLVAHTPGRLSTGLWTFPAGPGGPGAPHAVLASPASISDGGTALSALLDPIRLATRLPDGSLRRTIGDGIDALRGKGGRRVLIVFTDGGRPDGLAPEDLAGRDDTQIVIVTFGGPGCDKPVLADLAIRGELSCYDVDGDSPDEALSTIRTDLATAADGAPR